MRPSQGKLIIALFGPTCSGKTTVAAALAQELACDVRHCGEELKREAARLQKSASAFTPDEHRALDEATRKLASSHEGVFVLEGGFLDYVLADVPGVVLVKMICSDDKRLERFRVRNGNAGALAVRERDEHDSSLRDSLFRQAPRAPSFTLDSTELSVEACVANIRSVAGR